MLINDGSTDGSGEICDYYASLSPRIKVFHKPNEGLSKTRQFGLENATGEYIAHLDSDDFVSSEMYGDLYRKAVEKNADLVYCDWYSLEGKSSFHDRFHFSSWTSSDILKGYLKDQPGFLWPVMIRRSLFFEYNVRFDDLLSANCEDRIVCTRLLSNSLRANKELVFAYVPKALYYFDKTSNPGSLMKKDPVSLNRMKVSDWIQTKNVIDSDRFGKEHADRLVEYAFFAIWNKLYDNAAFQSLYAPHADYIRQYARFSSRKHVTLIALEQGLDLARRHKWEALPFLVKETIQLFIRKASGHTIPDPS